MKKKKWLIPITVTLVCLIIQFALLIGVINWRFFNIQSIDGQEVLTVSQSPDSTYTVTAYRNNGGATTSYALLCSVKNNETGKEKNIYWKYPCSEVEIYWVDNKTVNINNIELDVKKDTYDYRKDK